MSAPKAQPQQEALDKFNALLEGVRKRMERVKRKVMTISGKGGVGKSFITVNVAAALAKQGLRVGVFDADLHGPCVAKMLGVEKTSLVATPAGIIPAKSEYGVLVASIAQMLPDKSVPVIWRGPMKANAILELLANLAWGELDVLFVDLPPGTGDEPLTIAQFVPEVDGCIIVSAPTLVAEDVVLKAISFAKKLNLKVLAVVENMAYVRCPKCGEKFSVFGKSRLKELAKKAETRIAVEVPIDPKASELADKGKPVVVEEPESEVAAALTKLAEELRRELGL